VIVISWYLVAWSYRNPPDNRSGFTKCVLFNRPWFADEKWLIFFFFEDPGLQMLQPFWTLVYKCCDHFGPHILTFSHSHILIMWTSQAYNMKIFIFSHNSKCAVINAHSPPTHAFTSASAQTCIIWKYEFFRKLQLNFKKFLMWK
jgi:hypothetical protein